MAAAQKVERAAAKAAASRDALELAIREQHREGVSLRKLAELTGMSHETIRRICQAG